ncbi:MAG: hypothetical protein IKS65_02900 [Bacteroidales bacterium]|nr:hypothetical protein [Bacteroidales bacterium]
MNNNFNNWQTQYSNIVSNGNNPYDQAGVAHNLLMATIEQRGSRDMTTSQVFDIVDNVIVENYGSEIQNFSSQTFATPILSFQTRLDMENFVNSLNIHENAKQEFLSLADILLSYEVDNLLTVIIRIVDFENNLINDAQGRNIYAQVLIASSIGRYSLCYWHERLLNDNTKGNRAQFWKKLFVALADVIGGVNGAIAGSATVVGGIAGGVAGAISTSTGFAKLWDIFAE